MLDLVIFRVISQSVSERPRRRRGQNRRTLGCERQYWGEGMCWPACRRRSMQRVEQRRSATARVRARSAGRSKSGGQKLGDRRFGATGCATAASLAPPVLKIPSRTSRSRTVSSTPRSLGQALDRDRYGEFGDGANLAAPAAGGDRFEALKLQSRHPVQDRNVLEAVAEISRHRVFPTAQGSCRLSSMTRVSGFST